MIWLLLLVIGFPAILCALAFFVARVANEANEDYETRLELDKRKSL